MRWPLVLSLTAGIAASACGGPDTGPSGSGSLRMMIKDSPFRDAMALVVTFDQVSVHKSDTPDGEWIKIGDGSERTCDLKHLESVQDLLGAGPLGAGHYTQIRLHVSKAVVYFADATGGTACAPTLPLTAHADVTIPSGEVKLNRPFDIKDGVTTTITIDFDGEQSVHQISNGQYMMSPVISIVSVQQ
jgi:hypothetical protein